MNGEKIKIYQDAFWLGQMLTTDQISELNSIGVISRAHLRFLLPYSSVGQRGFQPLIDLEQQAFCQILAHKGCIPGCLLFGYSLTLDYELSRRAIAEPTAYEYMFRGIEAFLFHHKDKGFEEEWVYFQGSHTLYRICVYLVSKATIYRPKTPNHSVIEFSKTLIDYVGDVVKLDS